MTQLAFRPPLFLVTGFFWLILSALVGLVLFLTMVLGPPLPEQLRLMHVHGALVGGVAQIILGAMLAFIPPLLLTGGQQPQSRPALYGAINAGAAGMLCGFAIRNSAVVAVSGGLVAIAFLVLSVEAIRQARSSLVSPPLNLWFYGVALVALLVGIGVGEAMAARLFPTVHLGQARLAHLHLNVQGFVLLTIIGTMHNLFPTVLNTTLFSPRLARATFLLLPAGLLGLIGGFLTAQLYAQLAAGAVMLVGGSLYAFNILRTWLAAGRPRSIASDHLLVATLFFIFTLLLGLLVAVNSLWHPPAVPFGTLHLVAYTHLALIGFITQTIFGALSHLLPVSLAVQRVESNKKRGPYLEQLTRLAEQWRSVQLGTLSLGTAGLALVGSLVWQFHLTSLPVKLATYVTALLLLAGIGLFTGKVVLMLIRPPEA